MNQLDEQLDVFDLFNINVYEVEAKPKKVAGKSNKSGKLDKGDSKSKKVEVTTYSLPLEIYMGIYAPFIFNNESDDKAKVVTEEDIKAYIVSQFEYLTPELLIISVSGKKVYCGINTGTMLTSGSVALGNESTVYVGSESIDLSSIMTDDVCNVDIEQINTYVNSVYAYIDAVGVIMGKDKNMILVPVNKGKSTEGFPITVNVLGRESFQITEEKYQEVAIKDSSSKGNEEEGEPKESEDIEIDISVVRQILTEEYNEFDKHVELQYSQSGELVALIKVREKTQVATKKSTVKEYPTNSIISLIFTRIILSPELFDDKKVISEDELLNFLHERYPEYSKERTSFIYSKEDGLIIPVLKGSTKGSNIVSTAEEFMKRTQSGNYEMFEYADDGITYRVESTPVSLTVASYAKGPMECFELRLPLIPGSVRDCIRALFHEVAYRYKTEFLVLLFYDKKSEGYQVFVPKQTNSGASVNATYEQTLMMQAYPVADIHSHCFYRPFFSVIDNADELGNRVYGVFGSFNEGQGRDMYRAGTGGRFVTIKKEQIFTDETASEDMKKKFVKSVLDKYEQGEPLLVSM